MGPYNEQWGSELPKAYINPVDGVDADAALATELCRFLESRVAEFKKLRGGVQFCTAGELNPGGKYFTASGKKLHRTLRDSPPEGVTFNASG